MYTMQSPVCPKPKDIHIRQITSDYLTSQKFMVCKHLNIFTGKLINIDIGLYSWTSVIICIVIVVVNVHWCTSIHDPCILSSVPLI